SELHRRLHITSSLLPNVIVSGAGGLPVAETARVTGLGGGPVGEARWRPAASTRPECHRPPHERQSGEFHQAVNISGESVVYLVTTGPPNARRTECVDSC